MTNDLTDQLTRIIEWISGLGFALPFAIFLIVQLFNRGRKESAAEGQPTKPAPAKPTPTPADPIPGMPMGLPSWLGLDQPAPVPAPAPTPAQTASAPDSQWGHNFDREVTTSQWGRNEQWGHGFEKSTEAEDDVLRWGSVFESDAEGKPIRWTSTFDEPGQRNVYGWEPAVWGDTFPPRDSEPVIHYG